MKNKKVRFESHKGFLQKCLNDNLTPNGLKFNREQTIGNWSEEVVTEKYNTQEEVSQSLHSHH